MNSAAEPASSRDTSERWSYGDSSYVIVCEEIYRTLLRIVELQSMKESGIIACAFRRSPVLRMG
jgi:hypothetical protein